MTRVRIDSGLPDSARRILWNQLWDKLLSPPRAEPGTPERIPTPEELADNEPRTRGGEQLR